jgi:hypothetical protein
MSEIMSRHEFMQRLAILPFGPAAILRSASIMGQANSGKCLLRGKVLDKDTDQTVPAKVHVVNMEGNFYHPDPYIPHRDMRASVQTKAYFYCQGEFQLLLPPGRYKIEACRGLDQDEARAEVDLTPDSQREIRLELSPLSDIRKAGWFSGNTHTHYHVQMEEDPDERLKVVPPAEGLDVSVISYLLRRNLAYRSNKFPIGRADAFSQRGTLVDVGQETRNNCSEWEIGYGHVLFMNIPELITPVSTGLLIADNAPDYPTLTPLCRRARALGGTNIWAHSGSGMECPVAVALGVVDAFNVNDGSNYEYDRYYRLLNCGFRLPLSTGTDWWMYDHNRVYVQLATPFSY